MNFKGVTEDLACEIISDWTSYLDCADRTFPDEALEFWMHTVRPAWMRTATAG
jgi:hypothetical protein